MLLFLLWWLVLPTVVASVLGTIAGFAYYYSVVHPITRKAEQLHGDAHISKNGFSAQKVQKLGKIDVVVIGSGMGGLTTAALLARQGKKVVVLEQHDVAGGCTHTFTTTGTSTSADKRGSKNIKTGKDKVGGYEYDTGLHYVGADVGDKRSPLGFLFHTIAGGMLRWGKLHSGFDLAAISPLLASQQEATSSAAATAPSDSVSTFEFSEGSDDAIANAIKQNFPDEPMENITSMNSLVRWAECFMPLYASIKCLPLWAASIVSRVTDFFILPVVSSSTYDMLRSCTKNEKLLGVMSYCYGDYGLPPKRSSFLLHAALATHFRTGAYYPVGGASSIAASIIPTIVAAGGAVFVRAPVSEILLNKEGSAVVGVRVRGAEILAPTVVSAAGVINTFNRMLYPPATTADSSAQPRTPAFEYVMKVRRHLRMRPVYSPPEKTPQEAKPEGAGPDAGLMLEPSCAMFTMYVGVNRSCEELGVTTQNRWLFPHWEHDKSVSTYIKSIGGPVNGNPSSETSDRVSAAFLPVVFISSASAKDATWASRHGPRKTVFEVITMADYDSYLALAEERKSGRSLPENRGGRYDAAKQAIQDRLMEVLYEQFPKLAAAVKEAGVGVSGVEDGDDALEMEVFGGSPLSNEFYIGASVGEIYGLAHTPERYSGKLEWLLRPKQESIKGLYLSGQDVIAAGIAGATFGGFMCAMVIHPLMVLDLAVSYVLNAV